MALGIGKAADANGKQSQHILDRHFMRRGREYGVRASACGSVVFGIFETVLVIWPSLEYGGFHLDQLAFVDGWLTVFIFIYSILFGIVGGHVLAWLLLRMHRASVLSSGAPARRGAAVGSICGLIMDSIILLPQISSYYGSPRSAQEPSVWADLGIFFMSAGAAVVLSGFLGGLAGRQLVRHLPSLDGSGR